jgi:hypothetical protein
MEKENGGEDKGMPGFGGQSEGKRPAARSKRDEAMLKKQIAKEQAGIIWLRVGTNGRLLRTR